MESTSWLGDLHSHGVSYIEYFHRIETMIVRMIAVKRYISPTDPACARVCSDFPAGTIDVTWGNNNNRLSLDNVSACVSDRID